MGILDKDAGMLLAEMHRNDVSCEAVMAATLERIETVNGQVNALVALEDQTVLMDAARTADQIPPKGALHGLPFAVKDLEPVAGLGHSEGSPIWQTRIAQTDSLMVSRLRAAGAIFIGKSNTPEFGLGSHSYNPVHGVTRNPYDLSRTAGGSSGGAAAALACRMVALADGSDMMGSLRNPAAFCNVYGFRPSWGVVPRAAGGETFLQQLSTQGPMGRSPADIALLQGVIAGPNPQVPHSVPVQSWTLAPPKSLNGVRIGWLGDWGGAYAMEDGILAQCEVGLGTFESLGAKVISVAAPFAADELWESWRILRHWAVASELGSLNADPDKRAQLKPEAIWEIEAGLALDAMAITRAGAIRSRWYTCVAALFEKYDALVLPSAQVWPFPAEWKWPQQINNVDMDSYHRWMEVVVPVSLAGLPCVNLPTGFGDAGLPMGMQLFGPKFGDQRLLSLAQTYHTATYWPDHTPSHIQHG